MEVFNGELGFVKQHGDLDAKKTTVGQFLDLWLRDSVKGTVARHTFDDYEGKVRSRLKPTVQARSAFYL